MEDFSLPGVSGTGSMVGFKLSRCILEDIKDTLLIRVQGWCTGGSVAHWWGRAVWGCGVGGSLGWTVRHCYWVLQERGRREALCRHWVLGEQTFGKLVGGLLREAVGKSRCLGKLSHPPGQHPCAQKWFIPALGDTSLSGHHLVRRGVRGGAPLLKGSVGGWEGTGHKGRFWKCCLGL